VKNLKALFTITVLEKKKGELWEKVDKTSRGQKRAKQE
jgi:hypothetical protein